MPMVLLLLQKKKSRDKTRGVLPLILAVTQNLKHVYSFIYII